MNICDRLKRWLKTHRERARTNFYPNITIDYEPKPAMMRRRRQQQDLVREGETADQALDRMIREHGSSRRASPKNLANIASDCPRQNPQAIVNSRRVEEAPPPASSHEINFDSELVRFTCQNQHSIYLTKSEVNVKFAKRQNTHHHEARRVDLERTPLLT